jgi:integrase
MTLADYTERWLTAHTARLAPNTVLAYRSALSNHVVPWLGVFALGELTTPIVRTFLGAHLAAGRRRTTVQAYQAALSTVLTDAVIDGELAANPAHGASRRLWPRHQRGEPKALNADQLRVLFAATDRYSPRWFQMFVRIAARTGLRLGEQLALRPESLLPDVPAVRITHAYHGAGRFGPPKHGRTRVVEVSPETMRLLTMRANTGDPYLFTGHGGERPLCLTTPCLEMTSAVAHAGLPAYFTLHCLRHTYASTLLVAGAPPQWVQQQLGHASITLTVDVYGSWLSTRRPDLLRVLEGIDEAIAHRGPAPAAAGGVAGRLGPRELGDGVRARLSAARHAVRGGAEALSGRMTGEDGGAVSSRTIPSASGTARHCHASAPADRTQPERRARCDDSS